MKFPGCREFGAINILHPEVVEVGRSEFWTSHDQWSSANSFLISPCESRHIAWRCSRLFVLSTSTNTFFPENVSLVANTHYYLVNVYVILYYMVFILRLPQCVIFQCVQRCSRNACSTHSRGLPIFGSIIQICRFWSVDFERAGSSRELMAVASL